MTSSNGLRILNISKKHLGEKYYLGIFVPKNNSGWTGPWDCAEFVSWCVYQASGKLYGCRPSTNPAKADAYTGYWGEDANKKGKRVSVKIAASTPGAAILRKPGSNGKGGHIVISDGKGGTIEAYNSTYGVRTHKLSGRRWDFGILVPGIQYEAVSHEGGISIDIPATIYRLSRPMMKGTKVREIQKALRTAGFNPGSIDGVYGPMTQAAVVAFQQINGLIADGEVGPQTATKLGITL